MEKRFITHNNDESYKINTKDEIKLRISGKEYTVRSDEINPETTLNDLLREKLYLKGTKRMCVEGGCGACVVAVTRPGDDKVLAINSCLVSALTCHDWEIDTIEGIGNALTKYHPVQQALVTFNGTQCGFCSPGMVMNMYALCRNEKISMKQVENSFGGNICRCTGYRPILAAFKSLSKDASSDVLGSYPDIEDFCISRPDEKTYVNTQPIEWKFGKVRWIKVFFLKDILSVLRNIGDEPYMLVAGNTSKGVYKLPKTFVHIDIISVEELTGHVLQSDFLSIGANMSLTNTMNLFNEIARMDSNFAHLNVIADHIDLIAHVAVRNIGTLAGNLMMKHSHNEFPSDIFLLLETFYATLTILDLNGKEITLNLQEFLTFDMTKKVVKSIKFPKLSAEYKYRTFKIMPRAQNAHALVNAGFLYQLDGHNRTVSSRIIFGNISSKFTHALDTENYLVGKELFNNDTIQGALEILSKELKPEDLLPEPSPIFRKQLAMALFYKSMLGCVPPEKLSSKVRSASTTLFRSLSSGIQDYETKKSWYPLTKPVPKIEALAQASGEAQYVDDIPDLPNQLHGKFVLAEAAPGSVIISIDPSDALAIDSVVRFFTKDDIPGENNFFPAPFGHVVEKIFCDEIVEYYDQPVGLLVATNKSILSKAAGLVKIIYTPPDKKPLLSVRDVLNAKATDRLIKERELKPKKLGTDMKHKIKGIFNLEGQYHFHMELQCCLAVPVEDGLHVYPSTQWMDITQVAIANMLNLTHNKVVINVRRCGGGFGAKISRNSQIACAVSLAAWLLRKPVRMSLSIKENMAFIGKRFPFSVEYEVDVNDSGVIQHLACQMYSDHAVGGNENILHEVVFSGFTGNYNTDPFEAVYYRVRTDNPANTWMRAPGTSEGIALLESVMDHIASELNLDPLQVRINNIMEAKLLSYITDLKQWANIDERKESIVRFNQENRWKKRGLSVVPMVWTFLVLGPLTATVSIYHSDGSVTISHGGIEIGQGINTKAAQACAFKLNIPIELVNVQSSTSVASPNCIFTGASLTSEAVCYGVIQACDELLLRMKPYRKSNGNQTWQELVTESFANYVNLTATAQYSPNSPSIGAYKVYGSCASEVEVDILTGQYQLTRVDLIEDVGVTLNPFIDVGQIEGGFIMGLGYHTTEKLVYDENGKLLTNNTWYYKPPGAKDIPIDFRVKIPKDSTNPVGVLQSKAVGEPPLCMAVSVPLAIRNAVASARKDSNPSKLGFYFFDGPSNVENTFMQSLNDFKQYTL